jgi:hypothetical protein
VDRNRPHLAWVWKFLGTSLLLTAVHFILTIVVAYAWAFGEIGKLAYREGAASPESIDRAEKVGQVLLSVLQVLTFPLAISASPPFWCPVLRNSLLWGASIAAFLSAVLFVLRRFRRRTLPGYCSMCDYNLTGNTSGVCPECGVKA